MVKAKILVIDDEPIIVFSIEALLSNEGYEVDTAASREEANAKMAQIDYDVILADIMLGKESGIDILREVKTRNMHSLVIYMTGYPTAETAAEAVRLGAYDYLPKPFETKYLIHVINKALQHKELVEENARCKANLEAIFKSIQDAIITVDENLVVIETNKAAEDICGFPGNGDVKGRKFETFLTHCSGQCADVLHETIVTMLPAEKKRFECRHQNRPRNVVSVVTYPFFRHQDKFSGCVMVVKNETRLADLECTLQEREQFQNMIGKSGKMQRIYSFIEALANTQTNVLITGENGTGKALVAEALHYYEKDGKRPFVVVNCASLSDNLLESELFGHVKGAFTGAVSDRLGRFQMADGGTIFLDEIGDISDTMQLRLLRIIEDREFERVGDSKPIKINVRFIAATNQDIRNKVKRGKFRQDLYYRLKVVELHLPPLRERIEDIPLLVDSFVEKFNKKFNKNVKSVSADVLRIFMEYTWPGNVRELQHVLEYAFVLCNKSIITKDFLPPDILHGNTGSSIKGNLSQNKKRHDKQTVLQALEKSGWNRSKAARLLGVNRRTVYLKIKEYGLVENGAVPVCPYGTMAQNAALQKSGNAPMTSGDACRASCLSQKINSSEK